MRCGGRWSTTAWCSTHCSKAPIAGLSAAESARALVAADTLTYFLRRERLMAQASRPTPAAAPTAGSAIFTCSAAAGTDGPSTPPPEDEAGAGGAGANGAVGAATSVV